MEKKQKIEEAFADYAEESLELALEAEDAGNDIWLRDAPPCDEDCPCND